MGSPHSPPSYGSEDPKIRVSGAKIPAEYSIWDFKPHCLDTWTLRGQLVTIVNLSNAKFSTWSPNIMYDYFLRGLVFRSSEAVRDLQCGAIRTCLISKISET